MAQRAAKSGNPGRSVAESPRREKSIVTMPRGVPLWPIERLKPYARNPRTHSPKQVRRLVASMLEFGFTNPILVDGRAGIVAGHGRLLAARMLRLRAVPVLELVHLTEDQRRAYLLADNRLALDGGWDEPLLLDELRQLEASAIDVGTTGFSDEDLRELEVAVRRAAVPTPPARQAAARAGKILEMLEFDTHEQRDQWREFVGWVRDRARGKSSGAALVAHATKAMKEWA